MLWLNGGELKLGRNGGVGTDLGLACEHLAPCVGTATRCPHSNLLDLLSR
jgi:hypothetical protein